MDMTKYAGTAFIKLADLAKGPKCKAIESIAEGQYGRPVITFSDGRKLSLNVTNTNILLELFGQDSHDWIGKLIELYVGPLRSQDGGETDGVKVRLPIPPAKSKSAGDDMDDEDPFLKKRTGSGGQPPLFFNMARQRTKVSDDIRRFWRLLDPKISIERAWYELNTRRDGAA